MMPREAARATRAELPVLDVLWERGPITVRKIVDSICGHHTPALHTTVKSLQDRW
ncbi:MAG: hypothetical protein GXP27_12375 [Planctomycetes bacterium]|nr:hypothetical protein [Planctomycetota bacterium]